MHEAGKSWRESAWGSFGHRTSHYYRCLPVYPEKHLWNGHKLRRFSWYGWGTTSILKADFHCPTRCDAGWNQPESGRHGMSLTQWDALVQTALFGTPLSGIARRPDALALLFPADSESQRHCCFPFVPPGAAGRQVSMPFPLGNVAGKAKNFCRNSYCGNHRVECKTLFGFSNDRWLCGYSYVTQISGKS